MPEEALQIRNHRGYIGQFTRQQARGAIPNGTRIKKVLQETGDATPLGTEGTVLGSLFEPDYGYAYFVEWADKPGIAIAVRARKIGRATAGPAEGEAS